MIECGGRGAEGRLKTGYGIDTVLPLKTDLDAYHDVMGLTRRKNFGWEPYQLPVARIRGQQDRPQTNIDWLGLAEQCEHRTCAELEHVVNEAARMALSDRRLITDTDILTALADNAPSF